MAKRNRYVRLTLANGDTRVVDVGKTCTDRYIERFIADLILPYPVTKWEVLA